MVGGGVQYLIPPNGDHTRTQPSVYEKHQDLTSTTGCLPSRVIKQSVPLVSGALFLPESLFAPRSLLTLLDFLTNNKFYIVSLAMIHC